MSSWTGRGLTVTAVVAGLCLAGLSIMGSAIPGESKQQVLPSAAVQRQLVSVLIREKNGNQLGSGVLVRAAPGGYWVATSRHVVQDHNTVCVVTADRKAAAALVWPNPKVQNKDLVDLALVWLPHGEKSPLFVATIHQKQLNSTSLSKVIATGYPTPVQPQPDGSPYTESPGLLVPLLQSPLKGGFDLSYTADIEKGMSGGGVFEGIELIGINGAHANPLWPGQWLGEAGKPVDERLQQKLELVSLGISAGSVLRHLESAVPPPLAAIQRMSAAKSSCSSYE